MTGTQALITVLLIAAATMLTRFLPFWLFGGGRPPQAVLYLGKVLPFAAMGMLVVYCLKDTAPLSFPYGIPEAAGVISAALLQIWRRNTLLSIAGATAVYIILVNFIF